MMDEERFLELVQEMMNGYRNCNSSEDKIKRAESVIMDFYYTKLKDEFKKQLQEKK